MGPKTLILLLAVSASALFLQSEAVVIAIPRKVGPIARLGRLRENPTLNSICKKTDYFVECFSTIAPLLKGRPINAMVALKAEIQAANMKFREAKRLVEKLTASPTTSKTTKECLSVCTENFDSALESLQDSLQAIAQRDRGSLSSQLSAVTTYVETCNDAFTDFNGHSPISVANLHLAKIGSNCLAIAQQVRL
ncbi:pectinesterase 3-like [Punica granatum]|uniref:Pectinesterase inhibitor domain-containing protein n=2 Tax=Punica granatum TaxID=22663 RepID=A0A218VS49_PUNGR|nr:pectinesterase 3-like [Punica granatum]OWM62851.1 hypothetical protein CDL15_Pgr020145 [Punica granatum]PKI48197.1 hypothetical protein CRG98_031462 [Punica granatum]